jgi:hypothetical protein
MGRNLFEMGFEGGGCGDDTPQRNVGHPGRYRGWRPEIGGRRSEDGEQRPEIGGQRSEDGGTYLRSFRGSFDGGRGLFDSDVFGFQHDKTISISISVISFAFELFDLL